MNIKICVANQIEKARIRQTHAYAPCGRFALSTLSDTCFKDTVFEVHVKTHRIEN